MTTPTVELDETVDLMLSEDYKERFCAEYLQLAIRLKKLKHIIKQWDKGALNFTLPCPRSIYSLQIRYMHDYLSVLEARASIEEIELPKIN